MAADIENFIQEQKTKLALERKALNQDVRDVTYADNPRPQWDKDAGRHVKMAEQEGRPRSQEKGLPLTNRGSDQKHRELGAQRKQEYNQYLLEKASREGGGRILRPASPEDQGGLPGGAYQRNRRTLEQERQRQNRDQQGGPEDALSRKQKEQQKYRNILDQQVSEKKQLHLQQYAAPDPIPEVRDYTPRREATYVGETQSRTEVPRLALYSAPSGEQSQTDCSVRSDRSGSCAGESTEQLHNVMARFHDMNINLLNGQQQILQGLVPRRKRRRDAGDGPSDPPRRHLREDDDYRDVWQKVHPKGPSYRKTGRFYQPHNGKYNVDALVKRTLARQERDEYTEVWEQVHRKKVTPREEPGRGVRKGESLGLTAADLNQLEWQDYDTVWESIYHKPSPRAHLPVMADPRDPRPGSASQGPPDLNAVVRRAKKRDLPEAQTQKTGNRTWREPSQEQLLPLGQNEDKKKQMMLDRNREYNEFLKASEKGLPSRRNWKEYSRDEFFPSGSVTQRRREQLKSERQQDYREFLQGKNADRRSLVQQTDEYKASKFPGMNESDNAKIQKERDRNQEYNQFLLDKQPGRRPRNADPSDLRPEYYATLPGMRDSYSARRRKNEERNKEYNEFLANKSTPLREDGKPPPAPKRGWATPTYEDMLDAKRKQEQQYRRNNDASFNQALEAEKKLNQLDREFEAKKRQYRTERQGILEDPTWLSPRRLPDLIDHQALSKRDPPVDSEFYATLPIGQDAPKVARPAPGPHITESEIQRQKERYRRELEDQIREAADNKRREKQNEMNAVYSGSGVSGINAGPVDYNAGSPHRRPAVQSTRIRPTKVDPYHSTLLDSLQKLDQISPRSELVLGRRRMEDYGGGGGGSLGAPLGLSGPSRGILDEGFEPLLNAPRSTSLAPPAGIQYHPASYVTQGAGGIAPTSVDEAYNFYATRNPLEDLTAAARGGGGGGGGGGLGGGDPRSLANQEVTFPGMGSLGGGGTNRGRSTVRFNERDRGTMDFPTDDDKKLDALDKAQAYRDELQKQIDEKKRKKVMEKEERERYERKLEREAKEFNPYGRGGGGAPMKDQYGNVQADLRSMRNDNENLENPRRRAYLSPRIAAPPTTTGPRDDLFGPPPVQTTAEGEQSHARGGHGIFGLPKTDAEKIASERYKDDLKRQIEERKLEEQRRREQERLEDEKEMRKVEEQQARMKQEYEEEQRKVRAKEEEARRKNEELLRAAQEQRLEAERRRREADERREDQDRREREAEMNARLAAGSSPPVPAAKTQEADSEPQPSTSNHEPPERVRSADVLNQLATMRKQLENERQRVETMLQTEKNEPDVFDPRLAHKPRHVPSGRAEIDVFETARQGNAVAVRRTPGDRANSEAAEDFNALKHKGHSESRSELKQMFPEHPGTADALETQQVVLLRRQEETLRRLREQREYDSGYPKPSATQRSTRTLSQTPQQLHSHSAFVDVDTVNYFPDDFDDIPHNRRNDSARSRRRLRRDSSPRVPSRGHYADPFGSSTSLNVDQLSRKNEQRLKRLREMQGDDVSVVDADELLNRFMSKQAHNRPPSGHTLQDDSWLFAGSKASGY